MADPAAHPLPLGLAAPGRTREALDGRPTAAAVVRPRSLFSPITVTSTGRRGRGFVVDPDHLLPGAEARPAIADRHRHGGAEKSSLHVAVAVAVVPGHFVGVGSWAGRAAEWRA